MGFFSVVKRGKAYLQLWPQETILLALYPEARFKPLMLKAPLIVPPIFAFLLFWVYYQSGGLAGLWLIFNHSFVSHMSYNLVFALTSTLIMALCVLFLPLHGLLWYGYRSLRPLNPKQTIFYNDLMRKMDKLPNASPTMFDFIQAINDGLKFFKDKEFLEKL